MINLFSVEITEAYQVLGNVESRKVYDIEVGSYFILRGSAKKETIRPVWRLLDDRIVNINARNVKQVRYVMCLFSTKLQMNVYSLNSLICIIAPYMPE